MSRALWRVCMYAVMNINMSCHSWHLLSWLYTYTCVHLNAFTCTALTSLAWCVHGAWLFHTPSTIHKITAISSHIAIQLHKLVPSLWSARTWVTQHVMPSPLQTQTLVEEQWEQWLQDKHIRSIFDKDSEIDWFCALRKDWTQSNVLFKAMYRRLFMIPVIPMCLWCS